LRKRGKLLPTELVELLRSEFALSWQGLHGLAHWERVRQNGLRLARITGADVHVVEFFALLHDCKRISDRFDPGHGARAADYATALRGSWILLPDEDFELLAHACRYHTDGWTQADVTVQTCWDADRLDLGRIGIRPDPAFLCTAAARDPSVLEWAWRRSRANRALRCPGQS
jgi:uncharacterized protein